MYVADSAFVLCCFLVEQKANAILFSLGRAEGLLRSQSTLPNSRKKHSKKTSQEKWTWARETVCTGEHTQPNCLGIFA